MFNEEHHRTILANITAAIAAKNNPKPRRPKVDTPRARSWADTVHTEPLPKRSGPFDHAVTIRTLSAEEGHKLAMILNG